MALPLPGALCHGHFSSPCPPDPFQLGWEWVIYSIAHAGNTFGSQQKPRVLHHSPGAGGHGPPQAPARLCPLLSLLQTSVIPALPEKSAGRMSRMGFSSTQENLKKKKKRKRKMTLLLVCLPGILWVICSDSELINKGLSYREALSLMRAKK